MILFSLPVIGYYSQLCQTTKKTTKGEKKTSEKLTLYSDQKTDDIN